MGSRSLDDVGSSRYNVMSLFPQYKRTLAQQGRLSLPNQRFEVPSGIELLSSGIAFLSNVGPVACLLSGNAEGSATAREDIADVYSNTEIKVEANILGGEGECEDDE
jgi:hypothetical protein